MHHDSPRARAVPGLDRGIDFPLEIGAIQQRYFLAGEDPANRNMDLEFGGERSGLVIS